MPVHCADNAAIVCVLIGRTAWSVVSSNVNVLADAAQLDAAEVRRVVMAVGEGIPAQLLETLVHRGLIEILGLPIHHCYSVLGTGTQARAQTITIDVAYELCLPIHDLKGALSAIGHAQPASIAFILIDVYHCPYSHFILLEKSVICDL